MSNNYVYFLSVVARGFKVRVTFVVKNMFSAFPDSGYVSMASWCLSGGVDAWWRRSGDCGGVGH